jgi:hypothetical protein
MCETDDHKPRGGNTHEASRDTPSPRVDLDGRAVDEQDHDLLILPGGIGISEIATGSICNTLGQDEQVAFSNYLKVLTDSFHHRALRIPLVIGEDLT